MKNTMMRLFFSAALLALAGGCANQWNGADDALSIAEEHPITVDTQVVTLTLAGSGAELSPMDKARVRAFAQSYLSGGHGPVSVTSPAGAKAEDVAAEARKALNEAGVSWEDMSGAGYIPADGASGEVVLSYTRYVATGPACGVFDDQLERDFANKRSANFGCATQQNIAAMIADPRDLVQPADEAPADAATRIRSIEKYRKGEKTSSETDAEIKSQVAE
jgi:pilus assembly protein CpaD